MLALPRRHHAPPLGSVGVNRVRIDPIRASALADQIAEFLDCGMSHVVHFIPADPTVIAQRDSAYRDILNRGDLNLPDGMSVVWALRLKGRSSDRMPGTDALLRIARWGTERQLGHYLYGGNPKVAEGVRARLVRNVPNVRIVGVESPAFTRFEEWDLSAAADRMRDAGADLVWVGLGTPKQDFVAEQLRHLGAAPVVACVGAAFDFIAGTKSRPPTWVQRIGLEWGWRLASEPRRLWRRYLIGNTWFVAGVVSDLVRDATGWAGRRT